MSGNAQSEQFEADFTPGSGSVGIVTPQDLLCAQPPNRLKLSCGKELGPITVRYETVGTLSPKKDNAILVIHALTGDAHVAGRHAPEDRKTGWWDIIVGPGKPLDTDRYFIICSNCLGGCMGTTGPASTNPSTGKPYALEFPVVTVEDMVAVQRMVVDHLGIDRLLAVIGGSLAGMQALAWPILYPQRVANAIVVAAAARLSPQAIAWNAIGRNAILSDPNWRNGDYYGQALPATGLAIARMIGHITYLSEVKMRQKFGRELRNGDAFKYDFISEFEVESYLDYQASRFVERFDANSYLYLTKAMDYFDLAAQYGSVRDAVARAAARFLVFSFTTDWLFPSWQSREMVNAMISTGRQVTYANLPTDHGHDAFLLDFPELHRIIRGFLSEAYRREVKA
ncbi:MAG: homoserine O-acetyltransferase [Phycisphaerae bacterium]|nr:homoserine O-acetyltransferase [Phycisphaerae bacterium]